MFSWASSEDPLAEALAIEIPAKTEPDEEGFTFSRYTTRFDGATLKLLPRLADRAFVVRPELPLFLPAGDEAVLYVSTPVWISGCLSGGDCTELFEIPSIRASDTWFGRDTCEGELCYATRTHARTDLGTMGARPHRAVTPLEIRNQGSDVLPIEQLRVPLPALSLYQDDGGRLWTDTVSLVREEDESSAAMTVSEARSEQTAGRTLLREPSKRVESGTIISAFSRFMS